MSERPGVALVGAGSMGGALLRGWLERNAIETARSAVFDPAASSDIGRLCEVHGIALNPDRTAPDEPPGHDALVVAVKPQIAAQALAPFSGIAANAVVISVIAGMSLASLGKALGDPVRMVRAMPNLPAAIGRGASGLYASDAVGEDARTIAETLLRAVGEAVWVEAERDIDAVTAVSGSGPAYVFLLAEAMAEAGEALGLQPEVAARLARATIVGAGAMLDEDPRAPDEMRRAVTSPGGTTEAALKALDGEDGALRALLRKAMTAAAKRAGELGA